MQFLAGLVLNNKLGVSHGWGLACRSMILFRVPKCFEGLQLQLHGARAKRPGEKLAVDNPGPTCTGRRLGWLQFSGSTCVPSLGHRTPLRSSEGNPHGSASLARTAAQELQGCLDVEY